MAEAFQRTHTDRTTYGYRQLAGTGPGGGPELKTIIFAGLGAALGIVFGTVLAGGGLAVTGVTPSLHPVQAGSVASVSSPAAVSPAPASSVPVSPVPASSVAANAVPVSPVPVSPIRVTGTTPVSKAAPVTPSAVQRSPEQSSVAQATTSAKASAAHVVAVSQDHRLAHTGTSRRRHLVRRWHHARHRIHPIQIASLAAGAPAAIDAPKQDDAAKPFIFTVEGDASIANYDALHQTIDTYEGESFSLDQTPTAATEVAWQDNVHYRCDQSGNCDLVRAGQAFLNTRRTK